MQLTPNSSVQSIRDAVLAADGLPNACGQRCRAQLKRHTVGRQNVVVGDYLALIGELAIGVWVFLVLSPR